MIAGEDVPLCTDIFSQNGPCASSGLEHFSRRNIVQKKMMTKINMLSYMFVCCTITLLILTSSSFAILSTKDFIIFELKVAVSNNNLKTVHQLLTQNRTDWLTPKPGWEIASTAAEKGNLPIIKYIAERKLSILKRMNKENETIAYIAAKYGHPNITEYLLENTKWYTYNWETGNERARLFDLAAEKGYLNIIRGRLHSYEDNFKRIAQIAANNGHLDIACETAMQKNKVYCQEFGNIIGTAIEKSRKRDPKTLELFAALAEQWATISYCPDVVTLASNHMDLIEYLAEKKCAFFLKGTYFHKPMEIAFEKNLVNQKFLECLEKENGTLQGYIGESKNTICHLAAERGRLDVIQFITKNNTSVLEKLNDFCRTVVYVAAENGYVDIVRYIVKRKPLTIAEKVRKHRFYSYSHTSAFNFAIAKNWMDMETLKYVVEKENALASRIDPEDGKTAGHLAAQNGNMEILQYLVQMVPSLLSIADIQGDTVLHILARNQTVGRKAFKFFIDKAANITAKNRDHKTVGHIAAEGDNVEIVQDLVERDSSILSALDIAGNTVLHILARNCAVGRKAFKFFIDKAANITAKNRHQQTVGHIAAERHNVEVVQDLVQKDPSILSVLDSAGNTVLHILAKEDLLKKETLAYFVDHGAPLTDQNYRGQTVGHIITEKEQTDLVKYLSAKEPCILTIPDEHGHTILHILARQNKMSVEDLKFFVDRGASLIMKNKRKKNVATLAAANGNLKYLQFIVEKEPSILTGNANCGAQIAEIAASRGYSNIVKLVAEKEPILLTQRPVILFKLPNSTEVLGVLRCLRAACKAKLTDWDHLHFQNRTLYKTLEYDYPDVFEFMKYDENMMIDRGKPLIFNTILYRRPNLFYYLARNSRTNLTALDSEGNNILFVAAMSHDLEKMSYILDTLRAPIDIEWRNYKGDSLLHIAVREALTVVDEIDEISDEIDEISIIKYLVEQKNACVNARGHENKTVLHLATSHANHHISNYLLEHGADPKL